MLIGFTGKLGSGKDTAASRLAELVAIDDERLSFAGPLKVSAAAALGLLFNEADAIAFWDLYKNNPEAKIQLVVDGSVIQEITVRQYLQFYGTEAHRDIFGDDFWVDQAMAKYFPLSTVFYYFTDARFPNEADAIHSRGGVIIRVLGVDDDTGGHVSEAGLPDGFINFIVDNSIRDDNFAYLDAQLSEIARVIGLPLAVSNAR